MAQPGKAVYAATKWGLGGWSEALRQEVLPEIRVTLVEPGRVATELTDHITDAAAKEVAEKAYEEMAIAATEIAEVIAFALSRPREVSLNEVLVRPSRQA